MRTAMSIPATRMSTRANKLPARPPIMASAGVATVHRTTQVTTMAIVNLGQCLKAVLLKA